MKNARKNISPPKWATKLLNWYCKPSLLEDLSGDLYEYFQRNVKSKGLRRAKFIYVIDVVKFFRPYTIRHPRFIHLLIHWVMLGSYIKTSGRSLMRNRLFSVINIAGLAVSLSVGLLVIALLMDIFSYDNFQEHRDRIYRVTTRFDRLGRDHHMATASQRLGKTIHESFPDVESVAIIHNYFRGDMKWNEKTIPLSGYLTNSDFLNVFSFPLIAGDAATALKEPFSIILTETSAKKIFNDQDALGKTIVFNSDRSYTVTGIMKDVPPFSHMRFDMLGSLSSREVMQKDDPQEMAWDNVWSAWIYVLLPEGTPVEKIQNNLDRLSEKENQSSQNIKVKLGLQPMNKIMVGEDLGNPIGQVAGASMLWIFGGLAFVVILSSCFNYTNLSIARSLRRAKEVGIRKVIGAVRSQVMNQFIIEAIVISLYALVIALGLFVLIRPFFLGLKPELQEIFQLNLSWQLVFCFVLFSVLIGILAGFFPALFFSKVNAVHALKDFSSLLGFKKLTLRKVLIVFQYTVSIILITSTMIIYKQYKHLVAYNLGFNTENVLNISLQGVKPTALKKDLMELPEVSGISQSVLVTSVGNYWGTFVKYKANPQDSANVGYNMIDENYLPLHGHKFIAGGNFQFKGDSVAENEVIVNEEVLKRFDIAGRNPEKALGEIITVNNKDMRIIGVLKNFQYGMANDRSGKSEVIFRHVPQSAEVLNVKIVSDHWVDTRQKIETIWKKYDSVHPFEAKFYDEQLEEAFDGLSASMKVAGFITFLAICIASLGLMGMVVFTTETRQREISIRKILGATERGLLYMLSRSFLLLLIVATTIALPLTIIFFEQIAFPEMGNHAPLGLLDIISGALVIKAIALIMIYSQTLKVAKTNPAEILKSE